MFAKLIIEPKGIEMCYYLHTNMANKANNRTKRN